MAKHSPADRAAGRFDAFRFARDRESLGGTVDVASLPRLDDVLIEGPALVAWRIVGTADAMGRPALAIELDGEVPLECQRCLNAVAWPVHHRTEVVLARDEAELARLDADSDSEVLLAATPLDPATLVEDELVLALPYAPRHADGKCVAPKNDE
jgi:uncharacterized protein